MLHAGIRALNSLADFEILQSFNEKYFGNTASHRNPTLLEVLHFEEEILRQKIVWKEKYETVISSWITPKSAKSNFRIYKIEDGLKAKTKGNKNENNEIKSGEEKPSVDGVKTEESKQENITPLKMDAFEADQPAVVEVTKSLLNKKPEPAVVISTDENAPLAVSVAATESTPAAVEQTKPATEENKPAAEENKTATDEMKPAAEKNKSAAEEINKPAAMTTVETSTPATTKIEKLARPVNINEKHEPIISAGPENEVKGPKQEITEEKKTEPSKKNRFKRNRIHGSIIN